MGVFLYLSVKLIAMKIIRHILHWLKKWFWTKPTAKPEEPKATEVIQNYICVKYHDQWINLRKGAEVNAWNRMSRKDRRAMAQRFAVLEKKGKIKFVEIEGQMTCVKNKDYANKADTR